MCFRNLDDNQHSTRIFFDIMKHKYLEALDRYDLSSSLSYLLFFFVLLTVTFGDQYDLSFSLSCLQSHFGLLRIAFSFLDAGVLWSFLSFSYLMIMGFFIVSPLVITRNNREHLTHVEDQYLESLNPPKLRND